jgi:MFS transporter, ACS family, hexuronate transporter
MPATHPPPLPPPPAAPSVLLRWTPAVAMTFLSFISLMDRNILSILSPVILRDLHLTAGQYGAAILVFSICYMLVNPFWGLLMDRAGVFVAIAAAVLLWSLASGGHALVTGFLGLCCVRGLLGAGEAAAFPAGLKTVTETLPPARRSVGLALAYSGGSLGALITPLVVVPVAMRYGWRAAFFLSAAAGVLWIIAWVLLRVLGIYRADAIKPSPRSSTAIPRASRWNRSLFAAVAAYGLGAAPVAFGLYAPALYLNRVMHVAQSQMGHLLWIPPAGWEAGYLVWGWIADRRRKQAMARGLAVAAPPAGVMLTMALGSMGLCLIPLCAELPVALTMLLFFLVMFFSGGFVVIALAHGATTQPASNTGFLAGICISGWSLTTGILMAIVGRIFDAQLYPAAFWLAATLPPIGVLLWWLLTDWTPPANPTSSPLSS